MLSFSKTTCAVKLSSLFGNGVPEVQQVKDGTIDLNGDGQLDILSSTYKMVTNGINSFSLEASSNNVTSIDSLKSINMIDISDTFGRPDVMNFGLLEFKLRVNNPGDTAQINIYFSEPVDSKWFKYDLINGWREYSKDYPKNVQFSSDRKSVILRLVDGGAGDSDGIANGIIVDPSGPGGIPSGVSTVSAGGSSGGSSGGGGCFIATAAFGSPIERHVQILKDFRDLYLLKSALGTAFVEAYYQYSPPIADVIERHNVLRFVVRTGLMPFIGFGYIVVHTSPLQKIIFLCLLLSLATVVRIRSTYS